MCVFVSLNKFLRFGVSDMTIYFVFEAPRKKRNTFAIWGREGEGSRFGKVWVRFQIWILCVFMGLNEDDDDDDDRVELN